MVESVNTGHESTRNVNRDAIQGCSEGTLANERIVNVVADYNNRTTVEFLRDIVHNLQL